MFKGKVGIAIRGVYRFVRNDVDGAGRGVPPIGLTLGAPGDLDTVHIEKSGKRREWSRLIHAVGVQRDAAFGAGRNDGETDATNGNHTGTSARRNVEARDRRLDVDQICDRCALEGLRVQRREDRKSTRLNSSP